MESIANSLEDWIKKLKIIYDKINENKTQLKIRVQKLFTKLKNMLSNREDELLLEIDKQYEKYFLKEDLIKNTEQLPNKIKISLNEGKLIDNEWNDSNNLKSYINACINIENKIKDINIIKENMQKFNNIDKIYVEFRPESDDDNIPIFKAIKNFGEIYSNLDIKYKFKPCPKNISEDRKYIVSGQNGNILTKKGHDMNGMGTICDIIFRKDGIYSWKIKILKTFDYNISIGVAPSDFNIHSSYSTYGWYFYLRDSSLRSGPPHNYEFHKTNLKKARNEIIVIMNMKKRTLKFIVDNEDKGDSFTDIPIDKPLSPAVLLYNNDDSIEISKYN
jgi:hypothetical protein